MMARSLLPFLVLIVLASAPLQARAESVVEPPVGADASPEHSKINTLDASPVDPGHYEIETAYAYTRAYRAWDKDSSAHRRGFTSEQAVGVTVTAGLVTDLDVALSFGHAWIQDKDHDADDDGVPGPKSGQGLGDLGISGRYRFFHSEEQALDLAYSGGFTLPSGTRGGDFDIGTSQAFWSFDQTLAASKDWGAWTANAALGASLPLGGERGNARGTLTADVAGGYQILPWLQPEVELNYSREVIASGDDADLLAVTAGLVMPVHDSLRLLLGVQQGVWGRNADQATTLAMTVTAAF